jgi:hypothetical protein
VACPASSQFRQACPYITVSNRIKNGDERQCQQYSGGPATEEESRCNRKPWTASAKWVSTEPQPFQYAYANHTSGVCFFCQSAVRSGQGSGRATDDFRTSENEVEGPCACVARRKHSAAPAAGGSYGDATVKVLGYRVSRVSLMTGVELIPRWSEPFPQMALAGADAPKEREATFPPVAASIA